ncbi:AzlD domain-containing protein [Stappia sp. GBMRC 2046]|uniref:AzlD domain-containing protein n=1 Tax=Stappia sediminis TaxID=2692190 RepID=A0A7X3LSE6_9HYPH|nr:AzlD domain-containing protein [Stappia sediminis]MXN64238.1 AzlD domain-containing protein [Stappia sediminis]
MIEKETFWIVTCLLGVGTFLIRFSFLGILGGRALPGWVLSHLRYVAVAVLPALITPLVLWPPATGGKTDTARLIAALAAFLIGLKNSIVGAVAAGMGTLYLMQFLLG